MNACVLMYVRERYPLSEDMFYTIQLGVSCFEQMMMCSFAQLNRTYLLILRNRLNGKVQCLDTFFEITLAVTCILCVSGNIIDSIVRCCLVTAIFCTSTFIPLGTNCANYIVWIQIQFEIGTIRARKRENLRKSMRIGRANITLDSLRTP